jgi:hypothetical protein
VSGDIPERDWRLLRSLHRGALDRYCARALDDCEAVIHSVEGSSHDRYLRLFRLLRDRDDSIAGAFNDLRRSTAIQRLASMILLGVVTDENLAEFSQPTREAATTLADISRPSGKRRNAP